MKTIAIAHEFPIVTLGLEAMIKNGSSGYTVTGTTSSMLEIFDLIRHNKPDVLAVGAVILEPIMSRLIASIRCHLPETHVLVFSEQICQELADAVEANEADGYVLLDPEVGLFFEALSAITSGTRYISPNIPPPSKTKYLRRNNPANCGEHHLYTLTHREEQILSMVAEGLRNADIADRLSIARRTVEVHRAKLMRKLQLENSNDLVKYAIKHDYVTS